MLLQGEYISKEAMQVYKKAGLADAKGNLIPTRAGTTIGSTKNKPHSTIIAIVAFVIILLFIAKKTKLI